MEDPTLTVTPAAIAAWADARIGAAVGSGAAIGCVAAVTTSQGTLWSGGYGWADRERRIDAHPSATPFRSGSTTKVMTATIAWQLLEEGTIGLEDDINRHLRRVQAPAPFGRVRVRDLLAHAAGFEERFRATLTADARSERVSRAEIERAWCHQRRPAGVVISYSNFSFALLGTVLEDVTGRTYRELVQERIIQPLELSNSGLELPGWLPDGSASEHLVRGDGAVVQPPLLLKIPFYLGSGGLFYSAEDGARFLRTFLAHPEGPALLRPASLDAMRTPIDDIAGGVYRGLGWWLEGGPRGPILRHGGQTESFRATMLVIPEIDCAIVVMCVGDRYPERRRWGAASEAGPPVLEPDDVTASFVETFCGAGPGPAASTVGTDGSPVMGHYRSTRGAWTTSERLIEILGGWSTDLRSSDDGLSMGDTVLERRAGGFAERGSGYPVGFLHQAGSDYIVEQSSASVRVSWLTTRAGVIGVTGASFAAGVAGLGLIRPSGAGGFAATTAAAIAAIICALVVRMWLFDHANPRLHSRAPTLLTSLTIILGLALLLSVTLPGRSAAALGLFPLMGVLLFHRAHRPGP